MLSRSGHMKMFYLEQGFSTFTDQHKARFQSVSLFTKKNII